MKATTTREGVVLSNLLREVGIRPDLDGYTYLKEAVLMAHEDPNKLNSFTKELYPAVAELCGTKPASVERSIRHALEVCFKNANNEAWLRYFKNCVSPRTGKVTSGAFIAAMVESLKEEMFKGGMENGSDA